MDPYRAVLDGIARACESAGRDPADVTLVAVTKTRTIDEIRRLVDLGHRDFGENYLQEALPKIEALPDDLIWHFVGGLQSKKTRAVAEAFDVVHSFDRPSQIDAMTKVPGAIDGFLQVNLAEDPQKSGVSPKSLDETVRRLLDCESVRFRGLMTIGLDSADAEASRPIFRRLRELAESFRVRELSMGMSGDMHVAIQEGSTHVRIGTALFGARTAR